MRKYFNTLKIFVGCVAELAAGHHAGPGQPREDAAAPGLGRQEAAAGDRQRRGVLGRGDGPQE